MSQPQTKRRTFLRALASVPGLGFLASGNPAVARQAASSAARDVIGELGVRSFINAAGTFTAFTGSLMRPEVMAAMQVASRKYVRLDDLHVAVGARIAELLGCQAALVTSGCASALSLSTAACVAGKDPQRIRQLPDTTGLKSEVLVQKSHRVNYDHAIRNAGVRMIEVETREELEAAINERTAMMFFLNFANPKGQVHHEEFVAIGKKHNIPTLIDAAADIPPVENLWKYTKIGFDLVGFSGGKGLRGPQSSGLLLGRKDLIEAARLNNSPNGDTLAGPTRSTRKKSSACSWPWRAISARTTPRPGRNGKRAASESPGPCPPSPTSRPVSLSRRSPTPSPICGSHGTRRSGASPSRNSSRSYARVPPASRSLPARW